jgi:hypothetical protein
MTYVSNYQRMLVVAQPHACNQEISMFKLRSYSVLLFLAVSMGASSQPGWSQVPKRPVPTSKKPAVKPGVPTPIVTATQVRVPTTLPTISYGAPQPRTLAEYAQVSAPVLAPSGKSASRQLMARVGGQNVTRKILHLRGLNDIEQADMSDLPEGAQRLLLMHIGKIAADQSDHYIVDAELAAEWLKTHPVPDHIKPPEKAKEKKKGCSTRHISMKCVQNEGEQALDKASAEWEKLRQQAEDAWKHAGEELTKAWEATTECFADHRLSLNEIPVKFSIAPNMSMPFEAGSRSSVASGEVNGSVSLEFPMQGDFTAQLDLFYIPCLPFVIRPRSLSADGAMTVGEELTASLAATGTFNRRFKIPPTGGPVIPIYMIPIIIAGVPVAELDVSAYIDGSLEVGGKGKAEGNFELNNAHTVQFSFVCDGGGCKPGRQAPRPPEAPTTASESAQLEGKVFVQPRIYTALQLNLNFNALSARAGPQPYLLGTMSGCTQIAAEQTEGKASTSTESHALTADLDWGVELRAEALVGGQVVGNSWVTQLMKERHVWFRDLAPQGSTALTAVVEGAPQTVVATPATYKIKMPSCYPYTDAVRYRVTWTGDATPAANAQCQWQARQGDCKFDPKQHLIIEVTWPTAGTYSLTVVPVRDDHRVFAPEPKGTQLHITVDAPPR